MSYRVSIDKTVDMFLTLSGEKGKEYGRVFCRTAAETVSGFLNSREELAAHDSEICYAAACIAFYRYTLKISTESGTLKAGDITVTDCSEKTTASAEKMMREALRAIEPLCKPKRFAFVGTGANK